MKVGLDLRFGVRLMAGGNITPPRKSELYALNPEPQTPKGDSPQRHAVGAKVGVDLRLGQVDGEGMGGFAAVGAFDEGSPCYRSDSRVTHISA